MTIDSKFEDDPVFVGIDINTSTTKKEQFERFDAARYIEQVTDYSHFSNWRNSMRFDAKKARLEGAIDYNQQLIKYAKGNLNGNSKDKVMRMVFVNEWLTGQLNGLIGNDNVYHGSYRSGGTKTNGESKKPWHKARHGRMSMLPPKGTPEYKEMEQYLRPVVGAVR